MDVDISVIRRDSLDLPAGDDFGRWQVLIEAESQDPSSRNPTVEVISRTLEALWEAGHPAVAACDSEDELPRAGGIRRLRG